MLTIQNAGDPYSLSYDGYSRLNNEMTVFAKVHDDMENLVIGAPVYFLSTDNSVRTFYNPAAYSKKVATSTREASFSSLGKSWGPVLAMARWRLNPGNNRLRVSFCDNYYDRRCNISNRRRFDLDYRY